MPVVFRAVRLVPRTDAANNTLSRRATSHSGVNRPQDRIFKDPARASGRGKSTKFIRGFGQRQERSRRTENPVSFVVESICVRAGREAAESTPKAIRSGGRKTQTDANMHCRSTPV